MPGNNGLKVCSFNAKTEPVDFTCCAPDTGCGNKGKCNSTTEFPDSLVAAMLAVNILPSRADIYNIQNVRSKCVVEHLLKEISRVVDIMKDYNPCAPCVVPNVVNGDNVNYEALAYYRNIVCNLNEFSGLCPDAVRVKDALECCNICNLDYVESEYTDSWTVEKAKALVAAVDRYRNIEEYNAYFAGSCLTLVKKSLCIVPETKEICDVDSLVLFFEFNGQRFINVNVNLGCIVNSFEDVGCKKSQTERIVHFLKEYEDCGAAIVTGAFGDFDYDTPQLFFRGDTAIPEFAQKFSARGIKPNPVPSDFPCDLCDPLYELLEFLLKNCKAEHIPYSWLLQYLRLQNCKKCSLYKLVPGKCGKKCEPGCVKSCCKLVRNLDDCIKCPETPEYYLQCKGKVNRTHLRNLKHKSDKGVSHASAKKCDKNECDKPACVPGKKCCCAPKCETKCENKCKVQLKKCECDDSPCEIKCKKPGSDDKCDDSRHKVRTNVCKDLCKKEGKSCCKSCKNGGKCDGDKDVCADSCDGVKFCDTLSVLKRELCMYNVLNKIPDVNNRYTGFYDHFNRCLDCKYPKGMFQAWAMCRDYERPNKKSRVIDNNSELMALDHFLVSDCLRNNISYACLSDLCITKCDTDVKDLIAQHKGTDVMNALSAIPYGTNQFFSGLQSITNGDYVFQYGGSVVKSFFTHRIYCVSFDFPHYAKGCKVDCNETLHGLGLTSLWSSICSPGSDSVSISVFEEFGLDRHPYFRNYFWNCLKRHNCPTGDNHTLSDVLLDIASCDDDSVICIQKKSCISEEDFYTHLLCILSNSDSRDRFILTIAFMDALYKMKKMVDLLGACNVPALAHALNNPEGIADLFTLISLCFSDRLDVAKFADSMNLHCKNSTARFNQVLNELDKKDIAKLLEAMNGIIRDNCIAMEVLIRHAARILNVLAGVECGSASDLSGIFCDNEKVQAIIEKIRCGRNAYECIVELVKDLGGDAITFLFYIINGVVLPNECC